MCSVQTERVSVLMIRPQITSYHEMRKLRPGLALVGDEGGEKQLSAATLVLPQKKIVSWDGKEGEGFDSFSPSIAYAQGSLCQRGKGTHWPLCMYERQSKADSSPCGVGQFLGRQKRS